MIFAEFYKEHNGKRMPAVGSDSVLPMDGRWGRVRCNCAAIEHGRKRGFVAFQLRNGRSLLDNMPWGPIREIKYDNQREAAVP